MAQQLNQNQNSIMLILTVVAILITILIPPGLITYWIMQPNVVCEQLPTIPITENESSNTKQQPSMSSVTCVIVKNTGYSPAYDVFVTINSENFFPERTGLDPEDWKYISRVIDSDRNKKVYFLNKFASGSKFTIIIPSPEKEPEIIVNGMWGGGKKIVMEKSTPPIIILIGLCVYYLGFLTCLLVIRFLLPRIRRIIDGPPPLNKLRVFRERRRLTQKDLAEKVGVTRQTINAIENSRDIPSLELAFRLAELFEVKIEDIFSPD
jgi:putative transcriptional regulator